MGNANSSQQLSNSKNINNKRNNEPLVVETNDDKVFNVISDISNRLFLEYNNEYLSNNFCSKISIYKILMSFITCSSTCF